MNEYETGELLPGPEAPSQIEIPAAEPVQEEVQLPAETDETAQLLELIHQDLTHPALTTDFQDYTVAEGLLLLLLVGFFISACIRLLKEGFSWL